MLDKTQNAVKRLRPNYFAVIVLDRYNDVVSIEHDGVYVMDKEFIKTIVQRPEETYLIVNEIPVSHATANMLADAWVYEFHHNYGKEDRAKAFERATRDMARRAEKEQ